MKGKSGFIKFRKTLNRVSICDIIYMWFNKFGLISKEIHICCIVIFVYGNCYMHRNYIFFVCVCHSKVILAPHTFLDA